MGHPKRSGVTPQANMTAQISDFSDILLGRPEDTFRYIVRKPPTADQVADGGESRYPDGIAFCQNMAGFVVQIRPVLDAVNLCCDGVFHRFCSVAVGHDGKAQIVGGGNEIMLHIPVTIFESNIFAVANNTDKNPCYLCARMRRGHLYSKAKELGCNKIALGHHFNDVIETTVMSMFYGSQLQAMPPKLHSTSFPGMTLIRPMYCIHEEDILAWKRYNELEFIQCACRFTENCTMCDNGGGGSKRQEVKTLLRRLKRDNPNIENSIFRSIHAVALDTMPGYKSEGVEHSFLERFNAMEAASDENE